MKTLTIGYSTHRMETLSFTAECMDSHDVIVLEEPPIHGFLRMLEGSLGIEEYLLDFDSEYPAYSGAFCEMLQNLHKKGKSIFQVEPFLAHLIEIHEHLASGGKPGDFRQGSIPAQVYHAEKKATGKLLQFYKASTVGSFEAVLYSLKSFALADAERFVLRDHLRAEAICKTFPDYPNLFIEAGEMHSFLFACLKRCSPDGTKIIPKFLLEPVTRLLCGKRRLISPGDRLTLELIFHPSNDDGTNLLAARSLIYNKLLQKEETLPDSENKFPHTFNEWQTIDLVERLSLEDCRILFHETRRMSTENSRQSIRDYLQNR